MRLESIRGIIAASVITVAAIFSASCASPRDQPPRREGYIVHAYHHCEKCGTVQGGIYEKGPFKQFPGPDKESCRHEWREISREEFKRLAAEDHRVDWSQEPAMFWKDSEESSELLDH
jgi:hypothetical protein